jgi:hypothetical protein
MKRHIVSRLIFAGAIISTGFVGVSMAVTTVPAGAAAQTPSVTCKKAVIDGTTSGFTGKLQNCSDKANTGTSGTISYNLVDSVGTIKWKTPGTTTVSLTYHVVKNVYCPKRYEQYEVTSTVTGGTGAAASSIPDGNQGTSGMCSLWSGWPTPPPKPDPWKFLYKDYFFYL